MPFAKFIKVREVSSEDDQNAAENLINPRPGKTWKTKSPGVKSAYVILEMEDMMEITGIDIGNEHSGFVEVQVGKSISQEFTDILITCSFMTPLESRSSNNSNRVRCFSKDALVPSAAEKKWSLVKVICTQPFNKHVQYGLSFIKVHVQAKTADASKNLSAQSSTSSNSQENEKPVLQIGNFKLRRESAESDESSSNLFSRWKNSKQDTIAETTAAASIRKASNEITKQANKTNADKTILDRNRNDLLFGKDDDDEEASQKEVRLAKEIEKDKERRRLEVQKQEETRKKPDATRAKTNCDKDNFKKDKDLTKTSSFTTTSNSPQTSKVAKHSIEPSVAGKRVSSPDERASKKTKTTKEILYRPFNQLLRGVVLVISGIQNPDRADLRSKALALGAKYKGDWDNSCTHLICAFRNTPKYNQVRGKGKIITRTWIEKCYNTKKYIPWRRFALDSKELTQNESDEEILDESLKQNPADKPTTSQADTKLPNDTLALYDLEDSSAKSKNNIYESSSASDTDDEIQRIENNNKQNRNCVKENNEKVSESNGKASSTLTKKTGDIYEASTDEEDYLETKPKNDTVSTN